MEPITLVLVVLGVLVAVAAAVAVYRARQASAKAGEITPQSIIVGELSGVARSFPLYAFPDRAFPIWGTEEPPVTTGRVHTEVLWQHPVMEH